MRLRDLTFALFSALVYCMFLLVFLYAIGFVENLLVPKSIDSGPSGAFSGSLVINAALLAVFAMQHSIMARPAFKEAWTRIVPSQLERSFFVLFATAALALLCWQWRPLPQLVWNVNQPIAVRGLQLLSWLGWAMVLFSTFLISHFQLFGLSQGFAAAGRRVASAPEFSTPSLYRYLRHPIYAGFIVAFWATPVMTLGHLEFAIATTGYIFIGIWFEERDLITQFGERYRRYRKTVGMLLPRI